MSPHPHPMRRLSRRSRSKEGVSSCLPSVCTAHSDALLASLLLAHDLRRPLLVEATSNQVNQDGGYTGMRPADFVDHVHVLCDDHGIDPGLLHFGGDHLGPQAWKSEPADAAMPKAAVLVASYVQAGYSKIHLDCSEGCLGEPSQVGDEIAAERAAELALVCEREAPDPDRLVYVVGTEVPPPGGGRDALGEVPVVPTTADRARSTLQAHRDAFARRGLQSAWARVAGLVVQPGLEFSASVVHPFDGGTPDLLSEVLEDQPDLSFEAHSTDYQKPEVFPELARRRFTVLKVGPALTFAYRQAVYALDALSAWMVPDAEGRRLPQVMEALMLAQPEFWQQHYTGSPLHKSCLRHFSYADRIRYYWTKPEARSALEHLDARLAELPSPMRPMLAQHFEAGVIERAEGLQRRGFRWHRALVLAQVQWALLPYMFGEA